MSWWAGGGVCRVLRFTVSKDDRDAINERLQMFKTKTVRGKPVRDNADDDKCDNTHSTVGGGGHVNSSEPQKPAPHCVFVCRVSWRPVVGRLRSGSRLSRYRGRKEYINNKRASASVCVRARARINYKRRRKKINAVRVRHLIYRRIHVRG